MEKFRAQFRICMVIEREVSGKTLEDALANAKHVVWDALCKRAPGTDYLDGEKELIGVSNNKWL